MEEKLGNLIESLSELVEKLDDVTTAIAASSEDFDPTASGDKDAFRDKNKDKDEQDEKLAEKIGKYFNKSKKKEPRKILQKVMPVSIVNVDNKALKQLKTIIPNTTASVDKDDAPEKKKKSMFDYLKTVGLGALALIIAPVVAFFTAIKTIGKEAWFLKLKDFIKNSKWGKMLGGVFNSIKSSFSTLMSKFPKLSGIVTKLFGGKSGMLTKVFSKISTIAGKIFGLVKDSKIISIAGKVGKLMGKLFLPVTIVWGLIQTVMGAVDGFEQDGVAGAIKGGVNALFDFLVVDLVKLIVSIPAWILEKIGLENVSKSLMASVDGIFDSIKKMFGGIVDVIVGVFTLDGERILQGAKGLFGGAIDLSAWLIGWVIDPVVNFFKDIFKFGDPEKPFSFKQDVIDPAVESIKTWFKNLISLGNTEDGDWSLTKFINEVEKKVVEFFTGIFEWGREEDGDWSLSTFVSTAFTKAKEWITGLFDWENISKSIKEKATWLKDTVLGAWNSVKEWFNDLFTWAEPSDEDGFIVSSIKSVVRSIKEWFGKMFKFDSTSSVITSIINVSTFLPNLVVSGLSSITAWFLELFGFDDAASDVKEWESKFSIGDMIVKAVKSVWNWFTGLFPDEWSFEIPEGLSDIGGYLWGKIKNIWQGVTEIFDKIANFDVGALIKNKLKSAGKAGKAVYDFFYGDEEAAAEAEKKESKVIDQVADVAGLKDTDYSKMLKEAQAEINNKFGGEGYADRFSEIADAIDDAIEDGEGDWKKTKKSLSKSGQLDSILKARGISSKDTAKIDELMKEIASGYTDQWGTDDVNKKGQALKEEFGFKVAGTELTEAKQSASAEAIKKALKDTGVTLGGQKITSEQLASGQYEVTESMYQEYMNLKKKLETTTDTGEKNALQQYIKGLDDVGVGKMINQNRPVEELPSTNFKLDGSARLSSEIPTIDTDQASDDINSAGQSINKGARQISDTVGEQFPKPNSPYAWEYLRMAGENINEGSRKIYEQSEAYKKTASDLDKNAKKSSDELGSKVDKMIVVMTETANIQKKTLEVLEQHGLVDKQGNTIVNSGGNTTNVNNVTVESDIMSFRDRVVGRLYNK
jgi:hypothetical protein